MSNTAPVSPQRRRFGWKVRLLGISGGLLLGLLIAEVALRIVGINMASPYVYDEHCGHRFPPNVRYRQFTEGSAMVTINRDGHRDREHARHKPPGVFRIAVLGDSFAEAVQIDREHAFWAVLERELSKCEGLAGQSVEVLNFGVSGYGTTQELQMLKHYVWDFAPDIVLVAFLPGNDVRNNSRELDPETMRPFHVLIDGELRLDLSFRDDRQRESWGRTFKSALVRNVRLCGVAYRFKENLKSRWVRSAQQPTAATPAELGLDEPVFAPPRDAVWTNAWAVTDAVLAEMHREVKSHDAMLVVATLNSGLEVHSDSPAAKALRTRLGVDDLDYPDRRVSAVGQAEGFPVILLTPRMRDLARADGSYFHGFANTQLGSGHWNAHGHRVAGELIAKDLCEILSTTNVAEKSGR